MIFQSRMEDVFFRQRHHDERLPATFIGAGLVPVTVAIRAVLGFKQDVHWMPRFPHGTQAGWRWT